MSPAPGIGPKILPFEEVHSKCCPQHQGPAAPQRVGPKPYRIVGDVFHPIKWFSSAKAHAGTADPLRLAMPVHTQRNGRVIVSSTIQKCFSAFGDAINEE